MNKLLRCCLIRKTLCFFSGQLFVTGVQHLVEPEGGDFLNLLSSLTLRKDCKD